MRRLILAAALAASAAPAGAQTAADLLPPSPVPDRSAAVAPPDAPGPSGPIAPGGVTGPGFVLTGVDLEGARAVPVPELTPIWAGLLGQPVGIATLDEIAARITAAYRSRGYVLAQAVVPEQQVKDGRVRIQVIEGFIDRVEVSGGAANQTALADRYFAPVPADRPLRLRTLERAVILSRDTFGAEVETVLEPSAATFGAADLGVAMTPDPFSGFAAVDNRGSRLYGQWTLSGGGTAYNLLGLNERLDGLVSVSPDDGRLAFGQLIFDAPIPALLGTRLDGARLEILAEVSRSDPDLAKSGSPDGLTALTNEANLRAGLIVPFIRSRSENLFGRLNFGWRETDNETEYAGVTYPTTDRLSVLEARLSWDLADRRGGVTLVDGAVRQGLDILGAEVGGDSAIAGQPDFTALRLNVTRLQRLDAAGAWSLWAEAMGQYATTVLPSAERFALGTSTIGRGFAPGNTTGDSGFAGRLELRRQLGETAAFQAAELYGFGDWGQAYDRSAARDLDQWETIASAGIGARIDIRDWLTITPEIARQLDGVATDTTDTSLETRFYIGAVARF